VLVYSTVRTACGQLPVDHNGRQTADTVLRRLAGYLVRLHVVDMHLVLGPDELFDHLDGLFAGIATGAENLDPVACSGFCHG